MVNFEQFEQINFTWNMLFLIDTWIRVEGYPWNWCCWNNHWVVKILADFAQEDIFSDMKEVSRIILGREHQQDLPWEE